MGMGLLPKLEQPEIVVKGPPEGPWPIELKEHGSILRAIEDFGRRFTAIEEYLESGMSAGQAFVRASERPQVSAAMLSQHTQALRAVEERLGALEKKVGSR